jgi:hypothetical protein
MKHAGSEALDKLEGLLRLLRSREGLTEKKRGVFYRKSRAFLHFHEDPQGFFADVRLGDDWQRLPVNTTAEQTALLAQIDDVLEA